MIALNLVNLIYFAIIILIIIYIYLKINYPKLRGKYGEKWVRKELKKLSKNDYILLNDIMIKDEYGTHQIDHIVISDNYIFVIEMKNYYGLIVGNQYNDKWIQWLGKHKNEFYNPLRQNYGHIKSLSKILNLDEVYFKSIICFSNDAKLNVKASEIVINLRDILKLIRKYKSNEKGIIDKDKFRDIIINSNIKDNNIRKEHINNITNKNLP